MNGVGPLKVFAPQQLQSGVHTSSSRGDHYLRAASGA